MFAAAYPKLRSWIASLASPSTTHASGMLILLILAAVTEAHSVKEPIRVRNPKASSSSPSGDAVEEESSTRQVFFYVAAGMIVSQTMIRLLTFISDRRTAAKAAAHKKDDDLKGKGKKSKDLSLDAFEDLDEETVRRRRVEHLATLGEKAELLGSDTEDDDYEESEESESESEEDENEEEEEE